MLLQDLDKSFAVFARNAGLQTLGGVLARSLQKWIALFTLL